MRRSRLDSITVADALARIRGWGEERGWTGYDPYDGLTSPYARYLTAGTAFGRRILTQAVKRSPINLRPALLIQPALEPKAIGLVLSAYVHLAAVGDERAGAEAREWVAWLIRRAFNSDGASAWGYHFDVQTRVFFYAARTPNTIATAFIAHALLDDAEASGSEDSAGAAKGACTFFLKHMSTGNYFRYVPGEATLVHNANTLACSVLARAGALFNEPTLIEVAAESLRVTLDAQREDGSWPYAASSPHAWVDNFHTGYVLESLAVCHAAGIPLSGALKRGVAYWESALFLDDLTPKYYPDRVFPIDAHCYAQAIDTWIAVSELWPGSLGRASKMADILIRDMLDPRGYVYFQRVRAWTNKVPFIRWSTAPSFRALARLHRRQVQLGPKRRENLD